MGAERLAVRGVYLGVTRHVVDVHARIVGGRGCLLVEAAAQRVVVARRSVAVRLKQRARVAAETGAPRTIDSSYASYLL
jgi:hypothetical protein